MLTSAVEAGINTFLFPEAKAQLATEWQQLASFQAFYVHGDMIRDQQAHQVQALSAQEPDRSGSVLRDWCLAAYGANIIKLQVGFRQHVTSAEDMQSAAAYCDQPGFFVLDCTDWQIIPAENMVATFQVSLS